MEKHIEPHKTSFETGVGFVINNKFLNNIHAIIPSSDRIIILILNYVMPIIIINVYAPVAVISQVGTAATEKLDKLKDLFYDKIEQLYKFYKTKGIVYIYIYIYNIYGDFNARVQTKSEQEETLIGLFTVDKNNITLETQAEGTKYNRARFLDFCISNYLKIMNTFLTNQTKNQTLSEHI